MTTAWINIAARSHAPKDGDTKGTSFERKRATNEKSPRDGKSAIFAFDGTYSYHTRARRLDVF